MVKYIVLTLVFIYSINIGYSQSSASQEMISESRELGVRFSGFDDFNVIYKKMLDNNRARRHRLLISSLRYNSNQSNTTFEVGYAFGTEKRKNLKDGLAFVHGWEPQLFLSYSSTQSISERLYQLRINPAIGYILGAMLDLSPHVYLSIEVVPSLSSSISINEGFDNSYTINGGFSSSSTSLSLVYRMGRF